MASRKKAGIDQEVLEAEIGARTDAIQARGPLRVPIAQLHPNPDQPRQTHDARTLEELKHSIDQLGILQPLLVRPRPDGSYQIVCGERRFRAAPELGLTDIPVVVRQVNDDLAALRMAYEENVQRDDLSLMDEASFLHSLIEKGMVKSQRELSKTMGVSEGRISQKLQVLKFPEAIVQGFRQHDFLTEFHARALARIEDEKHQQRLFHSIVERELSGRKTDELVKQAIATMGKAGKASERCKSRTVSFKDSKIRRSGKHYVLQVPVQSADELAGFFSALSKALKDKELHLPRQSDSSSSES